MASSLSLSFVFLFACHTHVDMFLPLFCTLAFFFTKQTAYQIYWAGFVQIGKNGRYKEKSDKFFVFDSQKHKIRNIFFFKKRNKNKKWKKKCFFYTILFLFVFIFFIFFIYFLFFYFLFFFFFYFYFLIPYFRRNSLNSRSDLEFKEFWFFPTMIFQKKSMIFRFFFLKITVEKNQNSLNSRSDLEFKEFLRK